MALVASVRNKNSYAGFVYSFAYVLIIMLEKGVVISSGGLGGFGHTDSA